MPFMRKTATILSIILMSTIAIFAAKSENVTVEAGHSKTSATGKITVKFVSVEEDSRCPEGTQCIWAGNARVKITLAKGKKAAKTFMLNSTTQPNTITFEGYDITFVDLEPHRTMSKVAVRSQQLTVSITRHK